MNDVIRRWNELGNVPVDDDGIIQEPFEEFPIGTDREEIWLWFEYKYNVSVAELMYMKSSLEDGI